MTTASCAGSSFSILATQLLSGSIGESSLAPIAAGASTVEGLKGSQMLSSRSEFVRDQPYGFLQPL